MLTNPKKENRIISSEYHHCNLENASLSLFNRPGALASSLKVFRDVVLRDLDLMKRYI